MCKECVTISGEIQRVKLSATGIKKASNYNDLLAFIGCGGQI